jgi:hypothetical protein
MALGPWGALACALAVLTLGHLLPAAFSVQARVRNVDMAVAGLAAAFVACVATIRRVGSSGSGGQPRSGGAGEAAPLGSLEGKGTHGPLPTPAWLPREQVCAGRGWGAWRWW